jgi:hypothetical protein
MAWTPIVGRGFTANEFEMYVADIRLNAWRPSFAVVHNTSVPSAKLYSQWQTKPSWSGEQWMRNLESYYKGMGWQAGPHLFVSVDKIWAFTPLSARGTHSPAWNSLSWGVETVGEFEREPFVGDVRTNLISALATLHSFAGLHPSDYSIGVRGIHFHKEDPVTTHKTCPGRNMIKADLVAGVEAEMQARNSGSHSHIASSVQSAKTERLTDSGELTDDNWLQTRLNAHGARLQVNGLLDEPTVAAVSKFQKIHGLKIDGIPGP